MNDQTLNLLGALAVGLCDVQVSKMCDEDLDAAQVGALLAVHFGPQSSVGDVAVVLDLTHSGAVRVIERLVSNGLVRRQRGPDRRRAALLCTPAGEQRACQAIADRQRSLDHVLSGLTTDEISHLHEISRKILEALPANEKQGWHICRYCSQAQCAKSGCPMTSTSA